MNVASVDHSIVPEAGAGKWFLEFSFRSFLTGEFGQHDKVHE